MALQAGGINFNSNTQQMQTWGQPMNMQNANWNYPSSSAVSIPASTNIYNQSYPTIPGRIINTEQDIAPREVPNDGQNVGVFLQRDLQRVYVKQFGGDGLIHTNTYVLANPQDPKRENENDILQTILQRLDGIEKKLNRPSKPYRNNNNRNKSQNQEVKTNE